MTQLSWSQENKKGWSQPGHKVEATGPGAREGILCLNFYRLKEQEVKIVFFRIQYSKKKKKEEDHSG